MRNSAFCWITALILSARWRLSLWGRRNCGINSGCSGMLLSGRGSISTVSFPIWTVRKPNGTSSPIWLMPAAGRTSSQTKCLWARSIPRNWRGTSLKSSLSDNYNYSFMPWLPLSIHYRKIKDFNRDSGANASLIFRKCIDILWNCMNIQRWF